MIQVYHTTFEKRKTFEQISKVLRFFGSDVRYAGGTAYRVDWS